MDILAGMLAYVAGIGALFAALAVSFFVFFATPHEPLQSETQPQNARAMLVRPSTPNKPAAEARAKQTATQSASCRKTSGCGRLVGHCTGDGIGARSPAQTRCIRGSSAATHPGGARPPLGIPAGLKL
jgi:hypothetical protein